MPIPRLPRPTLRRLCLCTFVTTLLAAIAVLVFVTFSIALPLRRAYYLELDYQKQLASANLDQKAGISQSVRPLIDDVGQLFFWQESDEGPGSYDVPLGLNPDGTAKDVGASTEAWIYLAGTAADSKSQPGAYTHKWKNPECSDPGYLCDTHLDAFRSIRKRWPKSIWFGPNGLTARTKLHWVDCDVSPMLCDPFWGLAGSNLLVHMTTSADCDYSMIPTGSCPVTWRWIGLPIYHPPWTRQIRIPLDRGGSTVVPAFPSAEEQMWNIMAYPGALDALKYSYDESETSETEWNSMCTVTPQRDEPPVVLGGQAPLQMWGMFRSFVDNPWDQPEWPYELELKCYYERYADILLGWWDDAADLVEPRSCVGIAEAREQKRMEDEEFWDEWRAREDAKHRVKYDKMMEETFANIERWQARQNQTANGKGRGPRR